MLSPLWAKLTLLRRAPDDDAAAAEAADTDCRAFWDAAKGTCAASSSTRLDELVFVASGATFGDQSETDPSSPVEQLAGQSRKGSKFQTGRAAADNDRGQSSQQAVLADPPTVTGPTLANAAALRGYARPCTPIVMHRALTCGLGCRRSNIAVAFRGGDVSFVVKAHRLQAAGATGVVFVDSVLAAGRFVAPAAAVRPTL